MRVILLEKLVGWVFMPMLFSFSSWETRRVEHIELIPVDTREHMDGFLLMKS